jgi:hypothetical protein
MFNTFVLFISLTVVQIYGSTAVWTDGSSIWAGNPFCAEAGMLLSSMSPAIDKGAFIDGFHCPAPGVDPSGCMEWFGDAPDIGACEYIQSVSIPLPPGDLTAEVF